MHLLSPSALIGPLDRDGRFGRNIVHRFFTDDATASMYDETGAEEFGRLAAAELRSAAARYPQDEYLDALTTELSVTRVKFRSQWERQQVGSWRSATKRLLHRTRGWREFDCETLHGPERDHWVILYAPRAPQRRQ